VVVLGTNKPVYFDFTTEGCGPQHVVSGNGADVIRAGGGPDIVEAGNGADVIWAGDGRDTVKAGNGADLIWGGGGPDIIDGANGDDQLFGQGGSDVLFGGNGNDVLEGGPGPDTLTGGPGADVFVYTSHSDDEEGGDHEGGEGGGCGGGEDHEGRVETITDFQPGLDRIDLSQLLTVDSFADGPEPNAVWVEQDGSDAIVRIDTNGDVSSEHAAELSIVLAGVDASSASVGDFVLV
jgi:Ca2+-binding RTX toxin-like protein